MAKASGSVDGQWFCKGLTNRVPFGRIQKLGDALTLITRFFRDTESQLGSNVGCCMLAI